MNSRSPAVYLLGCSKFRTRYHELCANRKKKKNNNNITLRRFSVGWEAHRAFRR